MFAIKSATGDYLWGNKTFTNGISYARRFVSLSEAEQHVKNWFPERSLEIVEVPEEK